MYPHWLIQEWGVMAETKGQGGYMLSGQTDTLKPRVEDRYDDGQIPSFTNNCSVRATEGSCENCLTIPVTAKPFPEAQPHKYCATSNSPTTETNPPITWTLEGHSEHYRCLGRWEYLSRRPTQKCRAICRGNPRI